MISWIQKNLQKHFRLVFFIILVAVALPMVVVYSQSSGGGRGGTRVLERNFYGINIENPAERARIDRDAQLSAMLQFGYNGPLSPQVQQFADGRVAALALADQLHLPTPDVNSDEVKKFITTLRYFQTNGEFDGKRYADFGNSIRTSGGTAELNRVFRDDARIDAVRKLVGGPGYLLPADIKMMMQRTDATWTVQVATVDFNSFNPTIPAPDEVLQKFFTENSFRYEVPARPQLSMVEFRSADYVPPVAPTEAELRAYYAANASSFPVPPEPAGVKTPTPADPLADNFSKVRPLVEAALKRLAGAKGASTAAEALTDEIYKAKVTANSPQLSALLTAANHPAAPIPSFAPDQPPADKPWLAYAGEAITHLNKDHFFSDPIQTGDGYAVLLWNADLPAYKPTFAEARARVLADYQAQEKARLFTQRGQALRAELQNAAKTPEEFTKIAASEKIELKTYAAFSLRQPPRDMPYEALESLRQIDAGQVSDMVVSQDGKGYLVYVQEKKLPDLSPTNPRFAEIQRQMAMENSRTASDGVLEELVTRELKRTEAAVPH